MSPKIALLFAIVVCGGCERESRIPSAPSGPFLAAAQIEGRVVDADLEKPIPGAHITTVQVCHPGGCGPVDNPTAQ